MIKFIRMQRNKCAIRRSVFLPNHRAGKNQMITTRARMATATRAAMNILSLFLAQKDCFFILLAYDKNILTLFFISSAILSSLAVFFTKISTFYSRCSTLSMFYDIIYCRLLNCFINTYFLSWSRELL